MGFSESLIQTRNLNKGFLQMRSNNFYTYFMGTNYPHSKMGEVKLGKTKTCSRSCR